MRSESSVLPPNVTIRVQSGQGVMEDYGLREYSTIVQCNILKYFRD